MLRQLTELAHDILMAPLDGRSIRLEPRVVAQDV